MPHDDRVVDQVQSLNDIVEIISSYIPLKRAGRSFKACCPFHQEKTPSFIVNADKQIFHCFGCGVGGDVFAFLMKYEQLSFPEALERLAERVHVPLPEKRHISKETRSETEELYQIYASAAEFYHANLKHPEAGKVARTYLAGRQFGEAEIEAFKLGFALPEWRRLVEFLSKKGFREQSLLKSGLTVRPAQGSPYDLFRNRVMFPIFNPQGKVIALGGRVMGPELPKYINSPESAIFKKRKELYGLHIAKQVIAAMGDIRRVMIVEGYLDAIRLHANGFKNAVATLGTSLTSEHVRMLKRYADEAIVVFDGDKAGEQASLRGLDIFLEEGMNVKVLSLPKGFDPDSLIQTKGACAMTDLIGQSQDVFDFKLGIMLNRYNRADSLGLLKITGEFLDTFSKINNSVLLDRYLKKLAHTLGVEENSLRTELKKLKAKQERPVGEFNGPKAVQKTAAAPGKKDPSHEVLLLSLMVQYPPFVSEFREVFPGYVFLGERPREVSRILEEMVRQNDNRRTFSISVLMNHISDPELKSFVSELLLNTWDAEEDRLQAFQDCLMKIKAGDRFSELKLLRNQIARAEELGDQDAVLEAMKAYQNLLGRGGASGFESSNKL
jgi:DNA primase